MQVPESRTNVPTMRGPDNSICCEGRSTPYSCLFIFIKWLLISPFLLYYFPFLCFFHSSGVFPFFLVYIMYGTRQNNSFLPSSQLAPARVPNFVSFTLALVLSSSVVVELATTHLARLARLVPSQLRIRRSVEDLRKPDRSISALSRPLLAPWFCFCF
jgi:hypothetical protein